MSNTALEIQNTLTPQLRNKQTIRMTIPTINPIITPIELTIGMIHLKIGIGNFYKFGPDIRFIILI